MKQEENKYEVLARLTLENARQTVADDFLLNVSAQLAKESIQWSFVGMLANQGINPPDHNDLEALYKQVQPYLDHQLDESVIKKLIQNNFLNPEGHEVEMGDAEGFLEVAERLYFYTNNNHR